MRREQLRARLWAAWIGVLAAVLLLSVFGRTVQSALREIVSGGVLAWGIGTLIGLSALAAIAWIGAERRREGLVHALWLVPLATLLPPLFPIVEERIHFVLFGTLGFLSLRLFPAVVGLLLCVSIAGLDELVQGYLPGRFADWRDVGMNSLSGLVGGFVALRGGRADLRRPPPMPQTEP